MSRADAALDGVRRRAGRGETGARPWPQPYLGYEAGAGCGNHVAPGAKFFTLTKRRGSARRVRMEGAGT